MDDTPALDELTARDNRDNLLADSDWRMLPDAPGDRDAWAAYRQTLRDLPNSPDWPAVQFPEPPN